MKLKEIHRTSTFAWSPSPSLPLLATGTVAGALDESFSNESQLEIWAPDFLERHEYDLGGEGRPGPKGVVSSVSRFNRLAWGAVDATRPKGVIAAGMENGELCIWDAAKILAGADASESNMLRNSTHTGPIRGLDFNPIQTNLLSTGAVGGEIYIWDLRDPSKPYSPGSRSSKLDEITALAWNHQVPHILSTSSSTGYTVVWDLRGKREVVALAYGGGGGTLAGGPAGSGMGGRRGMSDVAWHPDNATRIVTSSEDDTSPVVMVWDLRNARAPEKILTGHEKGVLSLSWCKQDSDLLLSCGKDNRVLCWNPQTSDIIGELPSADNWAFQVQWCPRNPDLFAAAFFDGTVAIHSIQSTNEAAEPTPAEHLADGADVFDVPGFSRTTASTLSLKQPPKWLRRPASASFGYGGRLASVSNLPGAQGKTQSSVVHVRTVVTEPSIVARAEKLQAAMDGDLQAFAQEQAAGGEAWKALLSLFRADSRDELVTLLGFSKEEIAARVEQAVAALKEQGRRSPEEQDLTEMHPREPIVSFAEPEPEPEVVSDVEGGEAEAADHTTVGLELTPSEFSATSDATGATPTGDGESTTTAPSLFGDDNIGTPQTDAAADFFSSMGIARADDQSVQIPHTNYGLDSSVAATIGSRPSSAASETMKGNTFRIYPEDEPETDRLVTKALVLGDFDSAVALCLSADRFADAILLAVRGGPELLARTQKAYFEKRTSQLPYLRLFQSIVTNDLADIVQNADLQEWQEIFVVLCTFASADEFAGLAEQLGQRLEFQSRLAKASEGPETEGRARELRKNATLTYLAAGRLERLVNIWVEELAEEEQRRETGEEAGEQSVYSAHAHALQTFVEKVTVFRGAIKYADADLAQSSNGAASVYKLAALYDRYLEYADLLAAQGLVQEAVTFLRLTPGGYQGAAVDFTGERERLLVAAGQSAAAPAQAAISAPAAPAPAQARTAPAATSAYSYGQPAQPAAPVQTSAYPSYTAPSQATGPYGASQPSQPGGQYGAPHSQPSGQYGAPQSQPNGPYGTQPSQPGPYGAPPQPTGAYGGVPPATQSGAYAPSMQTAPSTQGPYGVSQPNYSQPNTYGDARWQPQPNQPNQPNQPQAGLPPPPRANGSGAAPPGPPPKRAVGGWNDAPSVMPERRATPQNLTLNKPAAITSPFPNMTPTTPNPSTPFSGSAPLPPPPRAASAQGGRMPPGPPPQRGGMPPPPPHGGPGPYPPSRPPTGPPQAMAPPPPPGRMPPPPNAQRQPPGPPPPGQFAPPSRGPMMGQTPPPPAAFAQGGPPGPYARATPPPQGAFSPPQQPGPYGPPPGASPTMAPAQGGHMGHPGPGGPPLPPGPGGMPPPRGASMNRAPSQPKGPPPPKYPPGDRSHIPDSARPIFNVIAAQLDQLKQITPPQQKRQVDDIERRINPLFDALNCETLSKPVVDQLLVLTQAMEARDRDAAMNIHVNLLTRGSQTDDIGMWMSGVKQLIMRV